MMFCWLGVDLGSFDGYSGKLGLVLLKKIKIKRKFEKTRTAHLLCGPMIQAAYLLYKP
jgi:hypothetical protein